MVNIINNLESELSPKYVLMGHSYMVRDFLPRVSAKLNIPFVSDIVSVDFNGGPHFSKQVFNAKLATSIEVSAEQSLLSFQSAAFSSDDLKEGGPDTEVQFNVEKSSRHKINSYSRSSRSPFSSTDCIKLVPTIDLLGLPFLAQTRKFFQ